MAAHSPAASLVQIDLTVEGPGNCTPVTYSQRQIILTANKNVITIGRASKVAAKGFVPAEDNAWFDSAVMSRDHAEISVDLNEKKVKVRDKGSLHGTYLNQQEKLEHELRELKDGDRLTFGLPVDRGTSTFLPVSVKVGVSFNNNPNSVGDDCGTSTFQVPDDSDCSSDVDSYTSDNSVYSSNSATMNSKTSASTQPSLPPKPITVIDLTGTSTFDQSSTWTRTTSQTSHNNGGPVYIDISSPPSSPVMIRERRNFERTPSGAPASGDVEVLQLGVPNVNVVPVTQAPIQDASSLGAATSRLSELASTLGQTAQALEAIEPNPFDSDMDSDYSSDHNIESDHHDNDSELSDAESNPDYPEDPMDSNSSSEDDSSSDSDDEMDDRSDRSSALNEDLDSLENYSDNDSPIAIDDDERAFADLDMFDLPPAPSPLPLPVTLEKPSPIQLQGPPIPAASDEHDDTFDNTMSNCTSPAFPGNEKKGRTVIKNTSPIAIEKLLNDRPGLSRNILTPLPELRRDESPKPWPMMGGGDYESLGLRTGKVDFFAAREENKAYFNKAALDAQTTSRPASSVYALCNEPIRPQFEAFEALEAPIETSGPSLHYFSRLPPLSREAPSMCLGNHGSCSHALNPLFEGSLPADFEVTTVGGSVETREPETEQRVAQDLETKEPEVGKFDAQEVTVQKPVVQAVSGSNDAQPLVQMEQPKSILAKRKRKAENISEETTAGQKWNESAHSTTPEAAKAGEITTVMAEAESRVQEASMQLSRAFERPTKRVRLFRLAERVGIAAIGGAMVMGTLIYTAPTFA